MLIIELTEALDTISVFLVYVFGFALPQLSKSRLEGRTLSGFLVVLWAEDIQAEHENLDAVFHLDRWFVVHKCLCVSVTI